MAAMVNSALMMEATLATSMMFACCSLAALHTLRGQFLYLGGLLMSPLSTHLWLFISNIFFGSRLLFQFYFYFRMFVMCGFVVYDKQLIVEKRRLGNNGLTLHGLELFVDILSIFKKIFTILIDKEAQQQRDNRRRTNVTE